MEAEPHLALLSSADVTQAVEAAYDLEEFVTERTVLNAFADVLRNYPVNGIDEDVVLQILEVLKGAFDLVIPKQKLVAPAVCHLFTLSDEELVQQHAAIALGNFCRASGVPKALETLVLDDDADIDLRHCALASLGENLDMMSCLDPLKRIAAAGCEAGITSSCERYLERL